jgi:HK97 family phage prohead protease
LALVGVAMMPRESVSMGFASVEDAAEHRDADGGKVLRVSGYAALFDTPSERMGRMVETLDRAAFDEVLAGEPDVRFLEQHGGTPIARTSNGTMRLSVDESGLRFEADFDPRSHRARDVYYAIERGDLSQMSFGFVIGDERNMGEDEDGVTRMHVTRVERLLEISAVTFPAYEPTSVMADESLDADDEDEDSVDADEERCAGCGARGEDCRCGDRSAGTPHRMRDRF